MNVTDFMTWETLGTYAGALAMVLLLTQLTKELSFLKSVPTQILSYIFALIVIVPATYFINGLNMELLILCLFNAVIISIASNGGFTAIQKIFEKGTDGTLLIDKSDATKPVYILNDDLSIEDLTNKKTITFTVNNKSDLDSGEEYSL